GQEVVPERPGEHRAAERRPATRDREVSVRGPHGHPLHLLAGSAVPDPQPPRPARGLPSNERNRAADDSAALGSLKRGAMLANSASSLKRVIGSPAPRSPSRGYSRSADAHH